MEFQTGLNQFNGGYYNPQTQLNQFDYNNTGYNNYNTGYGSMNTYDNSYQTTLNQFDNSYNLSSTPGLYNSNRNYGQFSTGGNLHDTFRVDRHDNLYGGHTTVDLGGGQKYNMDW